MRSLPLKRLAPVLGLFLLAALVLDPFEDRPIDDDFAYSWSVHHLLETGEYRAHDWAAPNPVFQVYLGAIVVKLSGSPFASLRLLTVALSVLALIAFSQLAREQGLGRADAALVTLALAADRLFLYQSCTFLTDNPFLCCSVLALWLYTRALRLQSRGVMLLASLASAAAILNRQVVAIPLALLCVWVLDAERMNRLSLYLAGLLLPGVATAYQFHALRHATSLGAQVHMQAQAHYLRDPWSILVNAGWRVPIFLSYCALFCLPLALLALVRVVIGVARRNGEGPTRALAAILALWVTGGLGYGAIVLGSNSGMPYLPWYYEFVREFGNVAVGVLTTTTTWSAVAAGVVFALRYLEPEERRRIRAPQRLMDLANQFLLLQLLVYYRMGDKYIWNFLPFVLIVLARYLRRPSASGPRLLARFRPVIWSVLVVQLAWFTLVARSDMDTRGAQWEAAEIVRKAGIPTREISGPWEWMGYWRYDEWVAEVKQRNDLDMYRDFWQVWLPRVAQQARYTMAFTRPRRPGDAAATVAYRDLNLRRRWVYMVERTR